MRPVQAGAAPPPPPAAARPFGLAPGAMSEWGSYYRGEGPEEEEEQEQQEEGAEAVGKGHLRPPHPLPSRRAARGPLPSGLGGFGPSRLQRAETAVAKIVSLALRSGLQGLGPGQLDFLSRCL